MSHPLAGRKQSPQVIEKRRKAIIERFKRIPMKRRSLEEKISKKIIKDKKGCWNWTGAVFKKEYGDYPQMRVSNEEGKRTVRVHRVIYQRYKGEIADGLEIDHICGNTLCINPEHLEAVSHRENMRRGKLGRIRKF